MNSVAILVPFMNEFGKKGFYQSQEFGLANAFYDAGWDVEVFRCIVEESYQEGDKYPIHYQKVRKFGSHALFDPKKFFPRKFDVIVTFADTQLIIPNLYKYCKKNGIIFIPYVGTLESISFSEKLKKTVMDFVYKHRTLVCYRKDCDYIFCKSPDAMDRFVANGVDRKKLVFSPVGVNLSLLNDAYTEEDVAKLRKENGYGKDDKVIVFVGRLNNEKRPLDTFKILDMLKDDSYKLIVIGDGFLSGEVEAKAKEYGNRAMYLKQVPYADMWKYYAMADCFINLWDEEIFGMAILEAIYYRTPAFLISAPGPRVIAKNMKNSFICTTIEEIAKRISQYKLDKESLEEDRQRLVKEFSWKRFVDNVYTVYGDKLEKR